MAVNDFVTDLDLHNNELQNAIIQNLSVAPSSPKEGQAYYNTANHTLYIWNGSAWQDALSQGRIYTEGTGIDISNSNVISVDTTVIAQQSDLPTKVSDLTNDSGYITGITGTDVTTALGYTPYNATNPDGYQANVIETIKVNGTAQSVTSKAVNITVPTNNNQLTNGAGYITGITSSDVTTALGFTPYNSTNPSGYQANVIESIKVNGTAQTITSKAVDITVPTNNNQLTNGAGYITGITSSDVTTALGFTPYNSTNPDGYISGITSSDVTTALGFTPYNSTNPNGYQANVIESIKVNGTAQTITSKAVNITVPTTVASLSDASDYAKTADLATVATTGAYSDLSGTPTVDQTYSGTSSNAQSGKAVKSAIDAAVASVYKPAGSVAFASLPSLSSSIEGNVYNVTDAFTTTSDFVEGSGKSYPAGTNVVCINTTGSTYKWDVLPGFVDLSGYQTTITGGATTITSSNLTASRALISNGSGKVAVSDVTSTELGYLDGVTSAIQTQLNGKQATISDLDTIRSGASKGATSVQKITATNPALTQSGGVCTWTISNTLATADVGVNVYLVSNGKEYMTEVTATSSNVVIKMNSASNIAAGTYKAVIQG